MRDDVVIELSELALSKHRATGGQANEEMQRYLPTSYGQALMQIGDGAVLLDLALPGLNYEQTARLVLKLLRRGLVSRAGYKALSDRGGRATVYRVTDPEARAMLGLGVAQ
jgi:hypothetical protein